MSTTTENRMRAREIMEQLDRRNLDGVVAHFAADAAFHGWAPQTLDRAGYQQVMRDLTAAFPDSRFPVDEWVAEGDKVVARHRFEGTHLAAFMGLPATGKQVSIGGIAILRFAEGKVVEGWLNADFLGLLQQIGAVPTSG